MAVAYGGGIQMIELQSTITCPYVRVPSHRDDAERGLSVYLRLQGLRGSDEAEARGLLYILLVRFRSLSTQEWERTCGVSER